MRLFNEISRIIPQMEEELDREMLEVFSLCSYEKIHYYFLPLKEYIEEKFLREESRLREAFRAAGITDIYDMVSLVVTFLYFHLNEKRTFRN